MPFCNVKFLIFLFSGYWIIGLFLDFSKFLFVVNLCEVKCGCLSNEGAFCLLTLRVELPTVWSNIDGMPTVARRPERILKG